MLAAEDRDFYEHGAISWRGLARASAANLLRRRISEGGSTITQQYVKNAFPGVGRDRTLFRKLKEAVLAVKLERKFSKDQILEFYMNTVYFGRGAYGIDAAARTYFKQKAENLKPAQSALLAGVIRSPEFYGKKDHATSAKARRNYILQAMVDRGWLTAKDGRAAMASKLGIVWTTKRGGIANSQGALLPGEGPPVPGRPLRRRGGEPGRPAGQDHPRHEDAATWPTTRSSGS